MVISKIAAGAIDYIDEFIIFVTCANFRDLFSGIGSDDGFSDFDHGQFGGWGEPHIQLRIEGWPGIVIAHGIGNRVRVYP